jgi:hypothetical protein
MSRWNLNSIVQRKPATEIGIFTREAVGPVWR